MSKQFMQFTIAVLGAVVIFDEIKLVRNNHQIIQMSFAIEEAIEVMKNDSETIDYLLDILNKHRPEIDEFDIIALTNLGVNFGPPEPR